MKHRGVDLISEALPFFLPKLRSAISVEQCGPVRLAIREARAEEASGKARGCAGFSTTKDTKIMNMQQAANLLSIGLEITDKRRMKKGHIKVLDLQPQKDVKGGGGATGNSKPITGGTGSTGPYSSH